MKNALSSLFLASALAAALGGCVVEARGHVAAPVAVVEVEEEPPPPRRVVVETRPGYVFVEGHWTRNGGRWVWADGYWERQRSGYIWVPGRWDRRGRRHVWIEGSWRANTVHRDHR
jgi:hypothetical protein